MVMLTGLGPGTTKYDNQTFNWTRFKVKITKNQFKDALAAAAVAVGWDQCAHPGDQYPNCRRVLERNVNPGNISDTQMSNRYGSHWNFMNGWYIKEIKFHAETNQHCKGSCVPGADYYGSSIRRVSIVSK